MLLGVSILLSQDVIGVTGAWFLMVPVSPVGVKAYHGPLFTKQDRWLLPVSATSCNNFIIHHCPYCPSRDGYLWVSAMILLSLEGDVREFPLKDRVLSAYKLCAQGEESLFSRINRYLILSDQKTHGVYEIHQMTLE